jgi:hypothetical protein
MRHGIRVGSILLLCVVLLVLFMRQRGGVAHTGPYAAEELREDFRQLRDAMESLHPKLYAFEGKPEFDRLLDEQYAGIDHSMEIEEFYAIVKPVVARIGCGHARVYAPEWYWHRSPERMFPLELVFLETGTYALRSHADTTIVPPGSEIVSINGRPIGEITDRMRANISADGYNEHWKLFRLNRAFEHLYALLYGYPDDFTIVYRAPDGGEERQTTLPPVRQEDIGEFPDPRKATGEWIDDNLGFEIIEDRGVAVMTITTFGYYDDRERFRAFIDGAFDKIHAANITNLILDVRGNDGGDPFCTVPLLSYIETRPVPYFATQFRQYEKFARPIPLAENRFEGNLVVLIDGGCYSSTGHLAAVLDYNDIGVFVGTETGGTYTCNDASKSIVLHNTGLRINMPRMTFAAAVSGMNPARGIKPDHRVAPRIEDLVEGRDTIREFAVELLQ